MIYMCICMDLYIYLTVENPSLARGTMDLLHDL